jgi:hypothetical protein
VNTIQEEAFIAVGESLGNWIDNKFSPRSRALRNLDQLAAMRDELYEQAHPNLPAGRSCHESGTSTGVRFVSGLFVVEQCIESPYERSTALVLAPDSTVSLRSTSDEFNDVTETPFDPDNRQHRACARTAVKIVRSLTDQ